jgi:CPA2 family monovalent cation:H+ antiporter-2
VQSAAATICGIIAGTALGLDFMSALILGIGLSVAGTAVLLKVLNDNHATNTVHGHAAVGWLVVEDIFTVILGLHLLLGVIIIHLIECTDVFKINWFWVERKL